MKAGLVRMFVLLLTSVLFFSTVYAADQPYLIISGPDAVVSGQSAQYNVSCTGAVETSYSWFWSYRTNECADIDEKGLLTAVKPGVIGIEVLGNDTGLRASLYVQVQPNEYGGVAITGPDKVVVGDTVRFTATLGGVQGETFEWRITSPDSSVYSRNIAELNSDTGDLKAVGEGTIVLTAVHQGTGISGESSVVIVGKEKKLPTVSLAAGLGYDEEKKEMVLGVSLSIMGNIPDGCPLYIAVKKDGAVLFLPSWQPAIEPYRINPKEIFYEKILSIPMSELSDGTYTFYCALLNDSLQLASNLSTSASITISKSGTSVAQKEFLSAIDE